jgi:hypothetical protein
MPEFIAMAGAPDSWLCRCGNTPDADGFCPVRGQREISPASLRWRGEYVCLRCGLRIHYPDREIIGYRDLADLIIDVTASSRVNDRPRRRCSALRMPGGVRFPSRRRATTPT